MDLLRPFGSRGGMKRRLRRRRCILHAGSPKTATSSVQSVLKANRERLLADGILVPRSGQTASGSHRHLAFSLAGLPVPREAEAAGRDLEREIAASDAGTVLISSEFLWSILARPEGAERVLGALKGLGLDVTILLYVRNQPQFLNSMYQHDANFRRRRSFATFVGAARRNLSRYGYSRWIELARIQSVPLLVRPFSEDLRRQSVIEDFLAAVGVPSAGRYDTAVALRRSVGPFTVAVAQSLMEQLGEAGKLTEKQASGCRHALRDELRRRGIADHGYCGLTTGLAAEIEGCFAEDNGRFAEFAWGKPWNEAFACDVGRSFEPNDYAVTGIPAERIALFDEVVASLAPRIHAIMRGTAQGRGKPMRRIGAALKRRFSR